MSFMDTKAIRDWYDSYMADFVQLGRGDADDISRLLTYWGVPLLYSTDDRCTVLDDEAQVLALAKQAIDDVRSTSYDRAEVLSAETTILNRTCALHRIELVRRQADGSEIYRGEVTYLITETPAGRRISALVAEGTP